MVRTAVILNTQQQPDSGSSAPVAAQRADSCGDGGQQRAQHVKAAFAGAQALVAQHHVGGRVAGCCCQRLLRIGGQAHFQAPAVQQVAPGLLHLGVVVQHQAGAVQR